MVYMYVDWEERKKLLQSELNTLGDPPKPKLVRLVSLQARTSLGIGAHLVNPIPKSRSSGSFAFPKSGRDWMRSTISGLQNFRITKFLTFVLQRVHVRSWSIVQCNLFAAYNLLSHQSSDCNFSISKSIVNGARL
jgi:hypothetical protein